MKFSELKGRAIVDREGAEKLGELDDVLIDSTSHEVIGS